jgi:hypothetical protein
MRSTASLTHLSHAKSLVLEGDEQFTVSSDRAEIAFIFGVTQHVTSVIFFKGPSSELWGSR